MIISKRKDDNMTLEKTRFNDVAESLGNYAIRKLTSTECWKLMGFTTEDVEKCRALGISDTQLYKQAGNSIVTNCIELLAEHLYNAQYDEEFECFDEKLICIDQ